MIKRFFHGDNDVHLDLNIREEIREQSRMKLMPSNPVGIRFLVFYFLGFYLIHFIAFAMERWIEEHYYTLSFIGFCAALFTLFLVIYQTNLLRKQIFGEIYDVAQIEKLEFFTPEELKYKVECLPQEIDQEISLGKEVEIPKDRVCELLIRFWVKEKQSIRRIEVGFIDDFKDKPEIIEWTRAFVAKSQGELPREVYIDWHDHLHVEYVYPRVVPKGEVFVLSFKVKGRKSGKYRLAVHIFTDETKEPYKDVLWVKVS